MINRIKRLGDLPDPIRKIAAQINIMSNQLSKIAEGEITSNKFPSVFRYDSLDEMMKKAREVNAETGTVLDVERGKDTEGKNKRGSGHVRAGYAYAVRLAYEGEDEVTGQRIYNSEILFCRVNTRELERLDREYKQIKSRLEHEREIEKQRLAAARKRRRIRRQRDN